MGRNKSFENNIKEGVRSSKNGSVKCKCNCSISHKNFNRKGWAICERCGHKVEKPKDKFRNKLKNILKGSDDNG